MAAVIRTAKSGDRKSLQIIWNTVFGDPHEEIDAFFSIFPEPGMAVVADTGTGPVAAGYILPTGNLLYHGSIITCAMIYSVATLPEYRNRGYGAAVVRELISLGYARGYKALVLCPSSDSMYEYYSKRSDMRSWFYTSEMSFSSAPASDKAALIRVAEEEYSNLREHLLAGTPHIAFDKRMLSYQLALAGRSGGGLFRADAPGGVGCAVVEMQTDGGVWIKELLASGADEHCVLSAIALKYPAAEYTVRTPALSPAPATRRFGMLAISDDTMISDNSEFRISDSEFFGSALPYYGLAFD